MRGAQNCVCHSANHYLQSLDHMEINIHFGIAVYLVNPYPMEMSNSIMQKMSQKHNAFRQYELSYLLLVRSFAARN